MFLLPLVVLLVGVPVAGAAGHLLRANLDMRRSTSSRHTILAALADTGRRPPGALLSVRAGQLASSIDFGAGISAACGCPAVPRTLPMPGRCCLPEPGPLTLIPLCPDGCP